MINLQPLGSHKSLASLTVPVPSSYPLESGQNKGTFGSLGMSMAVNCSNDPYVTKQIRVLKKAFANSWGLPGFSGMLYLGGFARAGPLAAPACPNPNYSLRPQQTPFPGVNVNPFFLWASSAR